MKRVDHPLFPYYRFDSLSVRTDILHFVSSSARDIGFSDLNKPVNTYANRCALATAVGFRPEQWVLGQQVHSSHVAIVDERDCGRGVKERESRLPETDALITDRTGICLMVMAADCVPLLLYDPVRRVIAAVHAGWRGTAAGIAGKTVKCMIENLGCRGENILAGIGPSIGKCCFEVGAEVAEIFCSHFDSPEGILEIAVSKPGKYRVDLWEANRRDLVRNGVKQEHIEISGWCTCCHPEDFFSYRYQGEKAGRFGAGILMK